MRGGNNGKIGLFYARSGRRIGISKSYMYELARSGKVPVLKLGKRLVIPKEKFVRWINEEKELGN